MVSNIRLGALYQKQLELELEQIEYEYLLEHSNERREVTGEQLFTSLALTGKKLSYVNEQIADAVSKLPNDFSQMTTLTTQLAKEAMEGLRNDSDDALG